MKLAISFLILSLALGCGASENSKGGEVGDMSKTLTQPTNTEVVKAIPQTLYIVMDPAKVADDIMIQNSKDSFSNFRSYLGESLQKTFEPYFKNIEIVEPGFAAPAEAHFIAEMEILSIEAQGLTGGDAQKLIMQWTFALKPSHKTDTLFSYSGTGESDSDAALEEDVWRIINSALAALMTQWNEQKTIETLRNYNAQETANTIEEPTSNEY